MGDAISRGLHMRAMNQGTSNQPLKCDKCDRIYHANIRPAPGTDAWEYLDSNIFGNLNLDIKTCWKCEES